MIQKLRSTITRIGRLPSAEDGALSFLQLAALIVGPIVAGSLALGAVSAVRLGGDLTTMFTRDASMTQMVERMQMQLTNVTDMDVVDGHEFTAHDQPSRRSAFYVPSAGMADVCVSNTWKLEDAGGTRTFVNINEKHETDSCDSPVTSTREWSLGGLTMETTFEYENAYGRDLTYLGGAEAGSSASVNVRPDGLFTNEWDYALPGFVSIRGELNQAFGTSTVDSTAKTPLKQLRPGLISSDLGELGPPLIARSARGGDTFRASMSALTVLNDPRTVIEWSWREAHNAGSTATDMPPASAWSAWSTFTTMDHFDSTVLQGGKWQVQAKYRVVLEDRSAESETVTMTWVRSIAKPAAPTTTLTIDAPTRGVTLTVVPAACTTGTTANTQSRYAVSDGAWSAWTYRAAAPHSQTFTAPEGAKVTGNGQTRCASPFTASEWVASAANPTVGAPITSAPTIDAITATVPVPDDFGALQAQLSGCPAGTTYEAQWRYDLNEAGFVSLGGFAAVNTRPAANATAVGQGDRLVGRITAKCVSPYFTASPTAQRDSAPVINPVRDIPRVINPAASLSGATGRGAADISACSAPLTYSARAVWRKNATTTWSYGSFTAASAGRVTRDTGAINEGDRFQAGIQARCAGRYANGSTAEATSPTWVIRPIAVRPTLSAYTNTISGATGTFRGTVGTPCPSYLTMQRRPHDRVDYDSAWNTRTWADTVRTGSFTWASGRSILQGQRWGSAVDIRCTSDYAIGPASSMYIPAYAVRPITTQATGTAYGTRSDGYTYANVVNQSSCPAGTSYRWRFRDQENNGAWSGWSPTNSTSVGASGTGAWLRGNAGAQYARTIGYGSYTRIQVHVVCRSDFANGPGNYSYDSTSTRPYPAPTNPSGISIPTLITGPNSRGVNNMVWQSGYPSYATTFQGYARVTWSNSTWVTLGTTTKSSPVYGASCLGSTSNGFASATAYIRAGNSTGWSGWASVQRTTRTAAAGSLCQ